LGASLGQRVADQRRCDDHHGKRHGKAKDTDKGDRGDAPTRLLAERAPRNPDQRLDDDDEHGRLDAEERCRHERQMAIQYICDGQREYDEGAR